MSAAAVAAPARSRVAARPARRPAAPAPRRPAPRRRAHLRVVAPVARARRLLHPAVLAALATAVLLFALVVVNVWLAQSQLALDQLTGRVDAAQRAYQQALLARAEAASASQIIARANQLGLVAPRQPPVAVPVPASSGTAPGGPTTVGSQVP